MKITSISAIPIRMPLPRVFSGSTYSMKERCTIVTRIETDEGVVSQTFTGDNRHRQKDLIEIIHTRFAPVLQGEDPSNIERCWQKMFKLTIPNDSRRIGVALLFEAIGAIDVALWNLRGIVCNKPVYQLLGGSTDRLQPIIIGGYYEEGKDLAMLGDEIRSYRDQGFAGAKVKVGGLRPAEDVRRIEAVRKAVGEGFIILCDANQGWSRNDAVAFGRGVRDLNIRWFEEPVHWYDEILGMNFVRQHTGLPVAAGQSEFSHRGCRELIEGGAVDVINFDIRGGGVTEWMKVASMAEMYEIDMAHHEDALISMHMLAAVRLGTYPEYFPDARDPLTPHILLEQPKIENGTVRLPDKPGFGFAFDEAFIKKYRVD